MTEQPGETNCVHGVGHKDGIHGCDGCCGKEQVSDPVNSPSHYTADPSGIECIEITRHRNFNIGNAIKYIWRAGLKDSDKDIQDLRKAIWYLQDEINRLNGDKP